MYDEFYDEPSEFEIQIEEWKATLRESVKKEYKEQVNIYPEFEKEFPIEEYLNTCENWRTRK